mmetsp:Transcript_29280/g.60004  ORF Transcript_29280/g.60004 Transcript_29280/m.60004 type:complete len:143 (-) Transcript_29280:310-738(-)|eukprot:CAMPEP_0171343870 /NCGR_PEP_ID=MMETSP0878-20121228/18215_1 /TAXON_ID=67004 /ORGANISM="Thalassiosira weissflogii, Strain CCMP1336" /LENGTH=142 /DNA_ID=CAMNT_0011846913 /DNA_START=5 /DNA_END=433 /DNA_ORIENTATION=+
MAPGKSPQESTVAPPTPPKPSEDLLLQSIKKFVAATNSTLAALEETTTTSSTALISRLRSLGHQGSVIASRAISTYEHRGQYGPQVVAGAVLLVGGAVGLRSGKIPGILAAGAGGAAAYGNIYGFQDYSGVSWKDVVTKGDS